MDIFSFQPQTNKKTFSFFSFFFFCLKTILTFVLIAVETTTTTSHSVAAHFYTVVGWCFCSSTDGKEDSGELDFSTLLKKR